MQYIFDYQDGCCYAEFANEYDDIEERKNADIEYLKLFRGEFFFFDQEAFFKWSYWPNEKLSREQLDNIRATKIYRHKNGTWREITGFFDKEIQQKVRREVLKLKDKQQKEHQEKLHRARLPNGMMSQQLNCVNLEE